MSARLLIAVATLAVALWIAIASAQTQPRGGDRPGDFDYYALTLSWSPTYCEGEGRGRREPQCDGSRPYAFVLHGLWPQYERGWPESCRTRERPWVPRDLIDRMLDIMPSRGLVIHQYRKHGTCSGLDAEDYFALSREAFAKVRIPARYLGPTQPIVISPAEIEQDFLKTNAWMKHEGVSIACGRNRRLSELRICLTRELEPRDCGPNETQRRLCSLDRIVMPPVRGAHPRAPLQPPRLLPDERRAGR
jgi:ribonuclease T2